jgi:hypothetical protein
MTTVKTFYDGEFLDDGERIWPISIGLWDEQGNSMYRVFADWLASPYVIKQVRHHAFLMAEVVPHLPGKARDIVMGRATFPDDISAEFADHPEIAPRWRIAQEIEAYFRRRGQRREDHELWAYYGVYDHVMLAQVFGTMMQLPAVVPMFTRDLMQLEAEVNERRENAGYGQPAPRPAKDRIEHHALADARWNAEFYKALRAADVVNPDPLAWTIHEERDLVTVPSRVFVAGYERLTSQGPDEGLTDPQDEEMARRLWDALL